MDVEVISAFLDAVHARDSAPIELQADRLCDALQAAHSALKSLPEPKVRRAHSGKGAQPLC